MSETLIDEALTAAEAAEERPPSLPELPEMTPEEATETETPASPPVVTYLDDSTRDAFCPSCRNPLRQERNDLFDVWFPTICYPCETANTRKRAMDAALLLQREREATIKTEIPPRYRLLADELLLDRMAPNARFPRSAWERLRTWYPHEPTETSLQLEMGRGLILTGDSGHYKTTIACALLARTHRVMGWSIAYLHAGDFGEAVQDRQAWKDDPLLRNRARATLEKARKARLLVIDDLGKEQSTATIYKQLKNLVEERCSQLRPTIVTTQLNGEDLSASLSQVDGYTGRALIRRLKDYCDMVLFS